MRIRFTARARQEFDVAAAWWRENRPLAPYLLEDEVQRAMTLLAEAPNLGTPILNASTQGIRRFHLSQTRYFLYYRVRENTVELLRLWHTSRRQPAP